MADNQRQLIDAESLAQRLDRPMGVLGIIFLLVIILAASQLLYIFADYPSYLDALYEAALATITGAGFTADTVFVRILHVVLAIFSVVVFATLAGTLGAYFLGREATTQEAPSDEPDHTTHLANNLRQEDGV